MKSKMAINFLPTGKEGGGLLPWVIAVMTYLSALSIASGFALYNMSNLWSSELSQSMTVQITNTNTQAQSNQVTAAIKLLEEMPEVLSAFVVSDESIVTLLEPWLGKGNVSKDLPIPAMITVQLVPERHVDMLALQGRLSEVAPDALLDGHQQWVDQLSALSTTIQATAGLAVILIMLTTIAIIVFATHARLSAHKDNIEIVHLMGATNKVIAGEFKQKFLIYGLKGGIGGLLSAVITIIIFYGLTKNLGDGLTPKITLGWGQLITLFMVPFFIAILSMITAEKSVKKSLTKLM